MKIALLHTFLSEKWPDAINSVQRPNDNKLNGLAQKQFGSNMIGSASDPIPTVFGHPTSEWGLTGPVGQVISVRTQFGPALDEISQWHGRLYPLRFRESNARAGLSLELSARAKFPLKLKVKAHKAAS